MVGGMIMRAGVAHATLACSVYDSRCSGAATLNTFGPPA